MNGFERSSGQDAEADPRELLFPEDFSPDEIAFATELRDLFSVEREELPPLYIQTLMQHEWDGLAAIERQQALMSIVFDRLGLPLERVGASVSASVSALTTRPRRTRRDPHTRAPRMRSTRRMLSTTLPKLRALPVVRSLPLSETPHLPELPAWSALTDSAAQFVSASRALIATAAAVAAVMLFSVLLTTPSFAQGLMLLINHTGVQQVASFPNGAHQSSLVSGPMTAGPANILWLGPQVGDFKYQATYLLKPETWSQGPIVDVRYALPGKTNGDGALDIREFLVSDSYSAVLQIVQEGAASQVQLNDGAPAVFVNGMWKQNGSRMVWSMNSRSELISEQGGIVCWMVADPRDGEGVLDLIDAAGHFTFTPSPFRSSRQVGVGEIGSELTPWLNNQSDGELYRLVARGESVSSTMGSLVLVRGGSSNAPITPDGTSVVGG